MSVSDVDRAIQKIRGVVREWKDAELNSWREDHTRYGVIDPIIRALGWDTSDPKECHPEYPRSYESGRRVDYALFGAADLSVIVNDGAPPDIIIESKPLRAELADAVPQLRRYAWASPRMRQGMAVLTSGNEWWIYDLSLSGPFTSRGGETGQHP